MTTRTPLVSTREGRAHRVSAKTSLAVAALASFALGACAAHHGEEADAESQALAEDGSDTSATESDAQTMVTSLLGIASARVAVGEPTSFYRPAGCLVVTRDDAAQTATYVFDHCTGPLGLLSITGTLGVTWSYDAATSTLDLTVNGTEVHLHRAVVHSWTATASITADGAARSMVWSANLEGTTARGRAFTRTNDAKVTWSVGGSCVTVDGTAEGQVAARVLHSAIASYTRCGGCPRSGTVAVTNETNGKTVSLAFDGSSEATFTAANGAKTDVPLDCTP